MWWGFTRSLLVRTQRTVCWWKPKEPLLSVLVSFMCDSSEFRLSSSSELLVTKFGVVSNKVTWDVSFGQIMVNIVTTRGNFSTHVWCQKSLNVLRLSSFCHPKLKILVLNTQHRRQQSQLTFQAFHYGPVHACFSQPCRKTCNWFVWWAPRQAKSALCSSFAKCFPAQLSISRNCFELAHVQNKCCPQPQCTGGTAPWEPHRLYLALTQTNSWNFCRDVHDVHTPSSAAYSEDFRSFHVLDLPGIVMMLSCAMKLLWRHMELQDWIIKIWIKLGWCQLDKVHS